MGRRLLIVLVTACAALASSASAATRSPVSVSAATGAAVTPSAPVAPSPLRVGLVANTQGWGDKADQRLDAVVDRSGVSWLREEFSWGEVQSSPLTSDWRRYDLLMTAAARRGVHILPLLMDTPSWAGPTASAIPGDPAGFSSFTAAVVARYGPGGTFWTAHPDLDASVAPVWFELFNEPYFASSAGGTYDPGRYGRLVKSAVIAGRRANPGARFLMAEETTGEQVGARWVSWYEAIYQAVPDIGSYFDGVAVHPYGTDFAGMQDGHGDQLRRLDLVHQSLVRHGDGAKPFWITEVGWPTCPNGDRCVSEAAQAADLQTAYAVVRSGYPYVRAMFVYRMVDDIGTGDPTDREQWFGLLRRDGSAKPAWSVFQRIVGANAAAVRRSKKVH